MNTTPTSGEALKQEELALLETQRQTLVLRGRRALLKALLLSKQPATADAVYAAVIMPADVDARCLGAVPGPLAKAGIIRSMGYVKSTRPERHASPVQLWELVDRPAAFTWLAEHPENQGGKP